MSALDVLLDEKRIERFNFRIVFRLLQQRKQEAELFVIEGMQPTQGRSQKEAILKGPSSPLEMRMYARVQSLPGIAVKVEDDSVNSILLDDNPGDKHERVLVAAHVISLL